MSRRATAEFYVKHLGAALAAAAVIFFVFEYTGLDIWISNLFFDPAVKQFPLRDDWFFETVLHHWAKYVLALVAFVGLGGFVLSSVVTPMRRWRREMLFVFLAILLGSSAIAILKKATNKHCPYDLEMYGGYAPYVHLLESTPHDIQPGRCWPGGHASGGFGLMAFYLVWCRHRRRLARAALFFGFTYGFVLGFGRVVQGAHFFSHALWSAVICWAIMLLLYELMLRRQSDPAKSVA